ncbi:MAG: hypothetical protein D6722_21900, partial [Bacteroidetes bacterium]
DAARAFWPGGRVVETAGGAALEVLLPGEAVALAQACAELLRLRGLAERVQVLLPEAKDWNEDLLRQQG